MRPRRLNPVPECSNLLKQPCGTPNLNERTGNVYENKGPAQRSTTPGPSLSKRGNSRTPIFVRGGAGGWAFAALALFSPCREIAFLVSKTGEQSENVYENKGPAEKSANPSPSLSNEGAHRAVLHRRQRKELASAVCAKRTGFCRTNLLWFGFSFSQSSARGVPPHEKRIEARKR